MASISVHGLAEALSDKRLLTPEQYAEFSDSILTRCHETRIIAAELVYRGWITAYQFQYINDGRAHKLFLGSYTIMEPLGSGSMGKVYLARNWKTQKSVALKLIREEHAQNVLAIRRFQREIRALGRVDHPNIVSVYDADYCGDVIFYIMEYVPGIDLSRLMRKQGPMSVVRACEYTLQAALALEHLCLSGLIHRDVKPANLLLEYRDRRIKLLDLGLARFLPDAHQFSGNLTRVGILIGTPDYISPEQIQDPHAATIRSDLYSLGCTVYHLLAGRPPFDDVPVVDKLYHQCYSKPTPIGALRGDLPAPLVKIVNGLLEKKPRRRPRRPRMVAEALGEVLELLRPYDSATDIHLEPETVDEFADFEGKLMPRTEHFESVPVVRRESDLSSETDYYSVPQLTP